MKLNMRVGLLIAGILVGSIAGLLYWKFVGCESGSCPVSSSPYISTLYGAILGGLLFSIFRIEKKDEWQISVRYLFLFEFKTCLEPVYSVFSGLFLVFPRQIACYPSRQNRKISSKETLKPDPSKIETGSLIFYYKL